MSEPVSGLGGVRWRQGRRWQLGHWTGTVTCEHRGQEYDRAGAVTDIDFKQLRLLSRNAAVCEVLPPGRFMAVVAEAFGGDAA